MSNKPHYHEDQYKAEVTVWGKPAGGGMKSLDIELARTQTAHDIDGKYIPDPLVEVIRRGADALETMLANGEINALDVLSFTVMKSATRSLTQETIRQAEDAAGIPRSI